MKILRNLSLLSATVALTSCGVLESMNKPIGDAGFNPLDSPGSYKKNSDGLVTVGSSSSNTGLSTGHGFKSGDIVEVAISNTALFKRVPQPGDKYIKVLKVGDSLRVLGTDKDFLKVAAPGGSTGYVSSVMVISQGSSLTGAAVEPIGDIAPPPEIPGIGQSSVAPVTPLPVPSITEPVPVDPIPVPSLPDPAPVPSIPDPAPVVPDPASVAPAVPDPAPVVPEIPSGEPAPEPEIPGLPD